jgi:phosphoribosyl-dephospho-CoA transferase
MYARHDLVWLSDQGWQRVLNTAPDSGRRAIEMWRQADWPAIVRRADADLPPEQLSIGIALPPHSVNGSKTRIGLRTAKADVKKLAPPLPVSRVVETVPEPWRNFLKKLERDSDNAGIAVSVFGSIALQALTGQAYVTAVSDIDLLIRPADCEQLFQSLDLLKLYAGSLPLDGEIVFPGGQAVAWKELSGALRAAKNVRVLVKGTHKVSLATTAALLEALKGNVCTI